MKSSARGKSQTRSSVLIRTLQVLLLAMVLANVAYYTILLYPPAGAALLLAAGRGPDSSFREALRGFWRYRKEDEFQEKYLKTCRVVKKEPRGFQLIETPKGHFWEPVPAGGWAPGMMVTMVAAQLAEMDSKYLGFPGLPVRKGGIVLDCGANVGVFTRAALDAGAKLVVAIEPAPDNILCLRRNFATEIASGRVIVYEKGVWDKDDFLTLMLNDADSAEDSFVRSEHTHVGPTVPLTTIDKLVQELSLDRVDFIKMDIEGAEQRALTGAQATLSRYHPRLEISVNHLPEDPAMVPLIVKRAWPGYRTILLRCGVLRQHWRLEADILLFE